MPNDEDILRCHVRKVGITETSFVVGSRRHYYIDLEVPTSEPRKWIHQFEYTTAILVVVNISEYDQLPTHQHGKVTSIGRALQLFDYVCNSKWTSEVSIFLILNNIDGFREKIPISPLKNYFPDYEGGQNLEAAADYIANRFVRMNENDSKQIYIHFTRAFDTVQIRFVMAAIKSTGFRNFSNPPQRNSPANSQTDLLRPNM